MSISKLSNIEIKHRRIRAKIKGTALRPRLAVSKSNLNLTAQLIDDDKGVTIAYGVTKGQAGKTLAERSATLGKVIAEAAKAKGVTKAVFDRGGYAFIGNIKVLADAAREAGLEF